LNSPLYIKIHNIKYFHILSLPKLYFDRRENKRDYLKNQAICSKEIKAIVMVRPDLPVHKIKFILDKFH